MLSFVFSVLLLNFILSSNGVSLISWTEDLHYALMNNPLSITDELKVSGTSKSKVEDKIQIASYRQFFYSYHNFRESIKY